MRGLVAQPRGCSEAIGLLRRFVDRHEIHESHGGASDESNLVSPVPLGIVHGPIGGLNQASGLEMWAFVSRQQGGPDAGGDWDELVATPDR